jgi:hypothetical protein
MFKHPWEWIKADLCRLQGQPESLTLEYKESKILTHFEDGIKQLSRTISAFANAEGGTIVVGMRETRGRGHLAIEPDLGVDPEIVRAEEFQYLLENSIQPQLPGIRCHVVPLADTPEQPLRVAYVVIVPKGTSAYQANDYVYYTRNGGNTEPMADHLVRLLMLRGTNARAQLQIGRCEILSKENFYEYRYDLIIENIGETSIDDFLLSLTIQSNNDGLQMWAPTMFVDNEEAIRDELISVESMLDIGEDVTVHERHELLHGIGIPFQNGDTLRCSFQRIMQILYQVETRSIFPKDQVVFPGGKWLITSVPNNVPLKTYEPSIAWTIYLDNAPPCSGMIDLAQAFPL